MTTIEDEREALVLAMLGWEKMPGDYRNYPQVAYAMRLADGALAAGFRRQGPITDAAQVLRDAADELEAPNPANRFRWAAPARAWLRSRAALEASRSAS